MLRAHSPTLIIQKSDGICIKMQDNLHLLPEVLYSCPALVINSWCICSIALLQQQESDVAKLRAKLHMA